MTQFGDDVVAAAVEILAELGVSATWHSVTTTPSATGTPVRTETNHAVVISPLTEYDKELVDGDVIKVGDASVFVAGDGLAFTPRRGDSVTAHAVRRTVVRVAPHHADDRVAVWEAQLRE